jgi:hypothetical protein
MSVAERGGEERRQKGSIRMKYVNLATAITICVVNVVLASFPLIGLMVLPSLMASLGWASSALRGLPYSSRAEIALPVEGLSAKREKAVPLLHPSA